MYLKNQSHAFMLPLVHFHISLWWSVLFYGGQLCLWVDFIKRTKLITLLHRLILQLSDKPFLSYVFLVKLVTFLFSEQFHLLPLCIVGFMSGPLNLIILHRYQMFTTVLNQIQVFIFQKHLNTYFRFYKSIICCVLSLLSL